MKKFTILNIIFLLLIFSVNAESQLKIKAKEKFTQAQQRANTIAPDAMLYAITSSASLDTAGKDISWLYYYYSAQLDTGIIVTTTFLGALLATQGPTLPGVAVRMLVNNFVDSDIALMAAQNAGGRQFMSEHPNATIFATVYKIPAMPDTTRPYWTIIYSDSSDFRIYIIDGITGQVITVGIEPISTEIPEKFSLHQNYPNPFNPVTKIRFSIPPGSSSVKLIIYDALGKEIQYLINENLRPGIYEIIWNASNYPSGTYFYRLFTDDHSETKKMILIK